MMKFLQQYSILITSLATLILAFVTGYYAFLTRRILQVAEKQSRLSLHPVIGIIIGEIDISAVFGPNRRQMVIGLNLINVGNAPAIEVLVDSEIELRYSNIEGEKVIPAMRYPEIIAFLRPGEENINCQSNFGSTFLTHFFDDVRESRRLNLHRIETDPTKKPYKVSRLKVFSYYRNSLNQYFRSEYTTEIDIILSTDSDPIPQDNETGKVLTKNIPRPTFHTMQIDLKSMNQEIKARNRKRALCGW